MKQQIFTTDDIFGVLRQFIEKNGHKRIFVFTGKASYQNASYKADLEAALKVGELITFYDNLIPNPTLESISDGIEQFKKGMWDMVLAIGGGSVLDSAKLITFFAMQDFSVMDYFTKKPTEFKLLPDLVAIPTTSGTGSESTQFATFYINKVKYSLDLPQILPKAVFIHPIFSKELPRYITACTAADALCQAIESYWNVNSTEESRELAKRAIKLISGCFVDCVNNPTPQSRAEMATGANLAGQAIQITRTTACHAVSYPMTSFFDVPHGQAVCVTLPYFLEFNWDVTSEELSDPRGEEFVKSKILDIVGFLDCTSAEEAKGKLLNLFLQCGLKTRLSELGIRSEEDIKIIIQHGFNPSRVKNNPRLVTEQNLKELLNRII